jgi:DNA-binding MltR family transcriptional regulator
MMPQNDLQAGWQHVAKEFNQKSDRAAAILGAAFLEAHLGQLIASFFIEECDETEALLTAERPLGTFSARVHAAYCMGLISTNEYHDLDLIMQIQHMFANRIGEVAFTNDGIREKCFMLRIPRDVLSPGVTRTPRQLYLFASAILTQHLVCRVDAAAQKRCQIPDEYFLVDAEDCG